MYKIVYYDELAEEMDDWSGEVETFEEAKELFAECDRIGFPCFIAESFMDEHGYVYWEEI